MLLKFTKFTWCLLIAQNSNGILPYMTKFILPKKFYLESPELWQANRVVPQAIGLMFMSMSTKRSLLTFLAMAMSTIPTFFGDRSLLYIKSPLPLAFLPQLCLLLYC